MTISKVVFYQYIENNFIVNDSIFYNGLCWYRAPAAASVICVYLLITVPLFRQCIRISTIAYLRVPIRGHSRSVHFVQSIVLVAMEIIDTALRTI